jgi:pyruvate formate lyase activating enzyme
MTNSSILTQPQAVQNSSPHLAHQVQIFDIQRFSLHDGPGVRTTVFLKGCNLHCPWCHNPESISPLTQLAFRAEKCVACAACVAACPSTALTWQTKDMRPSWNANNCTHCSQCTATCATNALELYGRTITLVDLLDVLARDRHYYQESGGGVTFSGGEASLQAPAVSACAERLQALGIHTALESNGLISQFHLDLLLPVIDLFLIDWKISDPDQSRRITGANPDHIRHTLARLNTARKAVILRCLIIPGINDNPEHLATIASLQTHFPCIGSVEYLNPHSWGESKRQAIYWTKTE